MKKAVLFRIKTEFVNEWKNWCLQIENELKSEAAKTLAEENVLQEISILFKVNEDYYGLGFMDINGELLSTNMNKEINIKHKEMKKKCIEYVGDAEVLYSVKSTDFK